MPVTPTNVEDDLLALRGVRARAVRGDERAALIDSLDRLLSRQLAQLPGPPERIEAAQVLFGLRGHSGQTLTARQTAAAAVMDYDADHFRKRLVPEIVADLAWLLQRDSLQYTPRSRRQPPPEASGDTPTITEADFRDNETIEHQVLLSRIWSDVYGLRADLIERERWRGIDGKEAEFREAAEGALWYLARLLTNLDRYMERYGDRILHAEAEFNAESLIRLAGWTGEITEAQARELRYRLKRVGEWERSLFVRSLVMPDLGA